MSQDDASRRDEINAFAAMANCDFDPNPTDDANDTTGNSGTFDFSAAVRAGNASNDIQKSADPIDPDNMKKSEDSFLSQLREADASLEQGREVRSSSFHALDETDSNTNHGGQIDKQGDFDSLLRRSFAQAGQKVDNSGTFSRLTPSAGIGDRSQSSGSARHRNQNLEAAALALADDEGDAQGGGNGTNSSNVDSQAGTFSSDTFRQSLPSNGKNSYNASRSNINNSNLLQFPCGAAMNNPNMMNNSNNPLFSGVGLTATMNSQAANGSGTAAAATNAQNRANLQFGQFPSNKSPMHVQQVHLPRPLFFGPNLPPRVLREAKKIMDEALDKQRRQFEEKQDNNEGIPYTPRLGQLPPGVRNLVSAIRCYGFGLDLFPSQGEEETDGKKDSFSGNSSFSTSVFCPRWSEDRKRAPGTVPIPCTDDDTSSFFENESYNDTDFGNQSQPDTKNAFRGRDQGEPKLSTSRFGTVKTEDSLTTTNSTLQSSVGSRQRQDIDGSGGENNSLTVSIDTSSMSERDAFSAFARHGSDYSGFATTDNENSKDAGTDSEDSEDSTKIKEGSIDVIESPTQPVRIIRNPSLGQRQQSFVDPESKMVRSSEGTVDDSATQELSEQALFTQWVHGGESPATLNRSNSNSGAGTFNFNDSFHDTGGGNGRKNYFDKNASGTFMNTIVSTGNDDSDDDSVVGSEMKKKVGVNEHLNAALASLQDEQSPAEPCESDAIGEPAAGELAQVPLTEDGGRPLSNQELMNAHAPLFAIDDPPLPSESDLGNHETREEQQRSKEQRRIQSFIEKFCPHNVFGPLACPNPATGPDDNHSWNSMSTPLQRNHGLSPSSATHDNLGSSTSPIGYSVSSEDLASLYSSNGHGLTAKRVSQLASAPKVHDPRTRYGWWNKVINKDNKPTNHSSAKGKCTVDDFHESTGGNEALKDIPIQLPPVEHSANACLVQTPLYPSPETLHKQNRPLSELHPATSLAQALPFLSDRPPSYRYLQVDTQSVAFPALGGEVEPLFCSMCIYHVETAPRSGDRIMSPSPDVQRCGKITETLNFDFVNNPQVEKRCNSSLYPYTNSTDNNMNTQSNLTRCGVFPLASNLSVYNLYAIITVSKVISEGSDFEPYLRSKSKIKDEDIDIESLRSKAQKACDDHGKFVMPFAFGVAPLLQVFGADIPHVPSSRAVQIPLFRFAAGKGEKQIIDHIMVMLYPRADHITSGIKPAPVTNGGTAMLVMRNFGYLGLHEVVNGKSSLAKQRLVDFTGEMQLRRNHDDENDGGKLRAGKALHDSLPAWQLQYKAEPTIDGGRSEQLHCSNTGKPNSSLYAQELAPVSLLTSPLGRPTGAPLTVPKSRSGGHSSGEDIEPYFHTTFCNELLCHPRTLKDCQKGNIVVKVEMREIEWNPEYSVHLAHVPACGPVVHNSRRGPFLVQDAYTSCSARCFDPEFLDEFKLKLPLLLGNSESKSLAILFTAYRLSFSSRKKWGRRLLRRKWLSNKVDEITGDVVGESNVVAGKECQLIQLACGFLRLEKRQSLIENGIHDVKISHIAKYPLEEFCNEQGISSNTLVLSDFTVGKGDIAGGDESAFEDVESQGSDRYLVDTMSATSASDRETILTEQFDDNRTRQQKRQAGMVLEVRISVQSSVHPQNATLNEFLSQEPDVSIPLQAGGKDIKSFLRSGKDAIIRQFSLPCPLKLSPPSEDIEYETNKLLVSTVDLAKPDMCSVADISLHLIRLCKQLWKVIVVGTGNHDIKWADPSATLPLRVNAFATLLQLLGSSTLFLSKRGVTQLDGNSKWDFMSLSRVVGLLFDEKEMFGSIHDEELSKEFQSLLGGPKEEELQRNPKRRPKRRHFRSNFEFGNGSDGLSAFINENIPTDENTNLTTQRTQISLLKKPSNLDETLDVPQSSALEIYDRPIGSDTPKIDTVSDFRNAMQTGNRENEYEDDIHEGQFSGNAAAAAWIIAFGGSSGGSNRRWMTAPGLSTIQEDTDDVDEHKTSGKKETKTKQGPLDALDSEIILTKEKEANKTPKRPVKQFRVPKTSTNSSSKNDDELFDTNYKGLVVPLVGMDQNLALSTGSNQLPIESQGRTKEERTRKQSQTLPATDADMLKAATPFLDAIEKSLGLGSSFSSNYPSEEEVRVYGRHHRKTVSHSSIDWSIPNDDLGNLSTEPKHDKKHSIQAGKIEEIDESMSTISQEIKLSLKLPSFADRLASLGDSSNGRWFPFTYEIIIMQWAAVLIEQQKSAVDSNQDDESNAEISECNEAIQDAASRTTGVIIACAPVLFEVIKQSLGSRVTSLIRRVKKKGYIGTPPLVILDDGMLANLEQLIAIITDACLDSRNFDSYETRQSCVDVNDSIVFFLRDMYAFLDPRCVYRLTMLYWSRLVAKDTRQIDRDSKIGLRCSHEIIKLQMNAVSAFVRFPDLIKVNSPQMNSWASLWTLSPDISTVNFFDGVLHRYEKLGLPSLIGDTNNRDRFELPRMRPHWLVEIIVDICFSGIEHSERIIQQRSASLLLELFWSHAQKSLSEGYSPIVASMYVTFIEKALSKTSYLSHGFTAKGPKSQVRHDIILCLIFVLQSAPPGLLRALWRKLFTRSSGKGSFRKFGGISSSVSMNSLDELKESETPPSTTEIDDIEGPNIYDMFSLLNTSLATVEYEGCDEHAEVDRYEGDGPLLFWPKEFLMTRERDTIDIARQRRLLSIVTTTSEEKDESNDDEYATTSSRKWLAHDASMVLIRTVQQIVRELRFVLEPMQGSQSLFNPARRKAKANKSHRSPPATNFDSEPSETGCTKFSYTDTVIFVRGATSVYLNSLVLRESDIAIVKTLNASVEIIKIFGIKIFNEAVGETLQHWLRMITFHCGSRRAEVRVPASDFAELILRSTWDCFGSFFRIRIPLLAVQTEVMERIVATAVARYYRDQRKTGIKIDLFSNSCAEASLTPLWRTTDRLHHQSASQNVAFRSSLVRLAEKIKKLHRAYIAAHALSFENNSGSREHQNSDSTHDPGISSDVETLKRANRISVIRVVNASASYSKQFLGLQMAASENTSLAHHEALEDAFLDAADVFSPTELPDHRIAWLRKLAQFHATRSKNAEEATCHYMIYYTLNRSCRLSSTLWSSSPFLPWIDNLSDGIHLEGPAGESDGSNCDLPSLDYGRQIDKTNSFRRIFYRNENSVRLNPGELEGGARKAAFAGVSLTSEYTTATPWITHREMEANMLEEAEAAGYLFQKSGIIASSRYMWGLAAQYYAEKFMYGKLTHVYERLARTLVAQVPNIDNTLEQVVDVGIPLGRFYRVWFHGGAPDELIGAEFVYRTRTKISLSKFGTELRDVLRSIIPENTPIHLVLDGRPEESAQTNPSGFIRMGGAPLEPVKVKVTPLRPVVRNESRIRGLPEWFKLYIDSAFSGHNTNENRKDASKGFRDKYLNHSRSKPTMYYSTSFKGKDVGYSGNNHRHYQFESSTEGELVGADKFWFIQSKDRSRGSRDWLKGASDDFAEKTIRVTQLQVRQAFPACISRQRVIDRDVYSQSPLEAAVDNSCLWCAVLFRTSIASNGSAVLGESNDPGIGIDAAKVVSECIHSSRVKEIGTVLLRTNTHVREDDDDVLHYYDRLSVDEVHKIQLRLARALVVFMELLHLLIARNRDLLLELIQKRIPPRDRRPNGPHEYVSAVPPSTHARDMSIGSQHSIGRNSIRGPNECPSGVPPSSVSHQSMKRVPSRGEISLPNTRTPSRDRSRHSNVHQRRLSAPFENTSSSADSVPKPNHANEDYDQGTNLTISSQRDRTDSAIGIQRELQLAFINTAKVLLPKIQGVMGSDTPRWLKQCCQDNYFSAYTYRQVKIPIGEELTFDDVETEKNRGSNPMSKYPTGDKPGSISGGFHRSDKSCSSQAPDSPNGSTGSNSVVSRVSDARSVTSSRSMRSHKERPMPRQGGVDRPLS
ncbi:unnamed protein product [Pseudo-nitzschia multistriata]|uniref:C2 DOCK-type domain-containing protein n=1 Tax=Pseudo-nitzschia multistriata TaxID=183589 RepID=A0A448Z2N2_9STRA|nr:unnamed protein product [Pseudo-nitzschia multistriata]